MVAVSIVGPDDGELIVNGPTRIRILEDGSNTAHRLGLGEIVIPPHTAGPPQHRHSQHDEGFYVLSGSVRFTVGEDDHDAPAGTWVMVPPGAPHTFANVGDDTAVMLNTFTPDLYVQYFRDLKSMVESGQPLTRETVAAVWTKYGTEPA
ncbi:cupin domain-containing protein [Cryptosporangium phraense]|uniref:Cupin domain-containing protein n=1 Tax=Cryptosporangium phraense TaxID=2593070 RepID=A0A545AGC2_9ACTN|nr:cupin domain-containing protein [Cryptosporangium phraense]TQS40376.1 cupin domain-containing protein [Cryptosporangium phraense]